MAESNFPLEISENYASLNCSKDGEIESLADLNDAIQKFSPTRKAARVLESHA